MTNYKKTLIILFFFQNSFYLRIRIGEVAEWSIAAVLKTVDCHRSGGSNPSLSAELTGHYRTKNSQVPQIQRFVGLFLFHYLCPIGYYLALYRIRIYTLVLTELQYICAILEQII